MQMFVILSGTANILNSNYHKHHNENKTNNTKVEKQELF